MAHEMIFPVLSERQASQLHQAIEKMAVYEEAGFLIAAQYADLKYFVGNALDRSLNKLIKEPFGHNGRWQDLSEPEKKLYDALFIPYPHLIAGWLKKAQGATDAAGPMRDAILAWLGDVAPLCERLLALKEKIGKRPPTKSAAQIKKEAEAKTCQICGRAIFAETGVIAHHGYQRPYGMGWQSASCEGARELPFEAGKDALEAHLENVAARITMKEAAKRSLEDDAIKASWVASWINGGRQQRLFTASPESFEAMKAEAIELVKHLPFSSYEQMKAWDLEGREQELRQLRAYQAWQAKRAAAWKQTLKREAGKWIAA